MPHPSILINEEIERQRKLLLREAWARLPLTVLASRAWTFSATRTAPLTVSRSP